MATPAGGRSILALSVVALLALGCFPVLAQADSSGIQYSDAPPTVTGGTVPNGQEPPASSSNAQSGGGGSAGSGSGGGSSAGGPSSNSPGTASTAGGGAGQQGKDFNGSVGQGTATGSGSKPASSQDGGGSSPLAPILIAIAALAAISLGAVMIRQRRRGASGSPVSPEAG